MKEENAYILGTETAELHRLGIQHQVWSIEAREAWKTADFTEGHTILDLGCGPGFCTKELAYMVGENGKVIGVDKSPVYADFLKSEMKLHGLSNVEIQTCSYEEMKLEDESLDGVYNRWALAWIDNVDEIINIIYNALKPGGVIASHEYYDWAIFQTEPKLPALDFGIRSAFQSFEESPGNINIGRHLPKLFHDSGMEVISTRSISKVGYNYDLTWQWPMTFLAIYIPKLEEMELLTDDEVQKALEELKKLEDTTGASICCPLMYEVIAVKT